MADTALNGVSFEFPSPWANGSCPMAGLVSFFYCREQGTIDKIRAKCENQHPGSYPQDWVQPAGQEWVVAFKLRQIKRKFQVTTDQPRSGVRACWGGGALTDSAREWGTDRWHTEMTLGKSSSSSTGTETVRSHGKWSSCRCLGPGAPFGVALSPSEQKDSSSSPSHYAGGDESCSQTHR
jgi:hypothetical protein